MKKSKLTDKLLFIILSIQTILMGIVFIIQVLRIYYGNNKEFTSEICGKYLLQILPIIIIWILLAIGSYIRTINNPKMTVIKVSNVAKLKALEYNVLEYNDSLKEEFAILNNEKKKRKIGLILTIVIVSICSLMGLGYLLNVKHFDTSGDLLDQAVKMGVHLIPWCVIALGNIVGYYFYEEYSSKKSIDIIKLIIKTNGKKPNLYQFNKKEKIITNVARIVILTISIVFIVVGTINGEAQDVLNKAINICTECIGLG